MTAIAATRPNQTTFNKGAQIAVGAGFGGGVTFIAAKVAAQHSLPTSILRTTAAPIALGIVGAALGAALLGGVFSGGPFAS